jgi:hypothetical protein
VCAGDMPGFNSVGDIRVSHQIPFLVNLEGMRSTPLEIAVLDEMVFCGFELSDFDRLGYVRVFCKVPLFV